ncbi:MAG: glycosyltransferase [Acidobacteria bacterium]|nr:MAG: glycosyltransferase [Acidobacteriota bacterium]
MTDVPGRSARVAVVVTQLGLGGAERQTTLLLERLAGTSWAPRLVVCLSGHVEPYGPRLEAAGYPLAVLPRRRSLDPGRLLRLRRLLRDEAIDLVHAVHMLASGYCALATWGSRRVLVPSARGTVVPRSPLRWAVYRRMLRRAPVVVANSERGARFLVERLGAPPDRVRVIPNGIAFDELRRAARPDAVRRELGLDAAAPVVAFVGKDNRVKNIPRLARVLGRLFAREPALHALVVGTGLDETARGRLFAGLDPERLHLLGRRDDVPSLLAAADVLLVTSDSEGCPNAVLEALAVGTPVVSGDVGDVGRMIAGDVAGTTVPVDDDAAYVEAVLHWIAVRDAARAHVLGEAPRIERTWGIDAMVRATVEAWRDALDRAR